MSQVTKYDRTASVAAQIKHAEKRILNILIYIQDTLFFLWTADLQRYKVRSKTTNKKQLINVKGTYGQKYDNVFDILVHHTSHSTEQTRVTSYTE